MKKDNLSKRRGLMFSFILLGVLTSCGNSKASNSPPASKAHLQTEASETESAVESDYKQTDTSAETETEKKKKTTPETATTSETEIPENTEKAWYISVLEGVCYDHVFADNTDFGFDAAYDDMSQNKFAVYDVDFDGKDELILQYTTAAMAGMVEFIYDYDNETDSVREEFSAFPSLTYYDNGTIEAGWSHSQGLSGRFWPYTLFIYDREKDTYTSVGSVEAWDKTLLAQDYQGNIFPDEIDADGDGLVYYIMPDGNYEHGTPVDFEEYQQWRNSFAGESGQIDIPYINITEENIYSIQ